MTTRHNLLWSAALLLATVLGTAALVLGVLHLGGLRTGVVVLGVVLLVLAWLVPAHWLPAAALAAFVLLPVRALPVPELVTVVSPALVLLAVWLCRSARGIALPATTVWQSWRNWILGGLVVWLLLGTVGSAYPGHSLAWGFTFAVGVVLVALWPVDGRAVATLTGVWLVLAAGLGMFAVVEFLLGANPVYGELYARGPFPLFQNWSVYRVTTTLGHPLNNGVFFAMSLPLALGEHLRTRRSPLLLVAALSGTGLMLTASRGALAAAALATVAVLVCALAVPRAGGRASRLLVALLAVAGLAAIAQSGVLQDRSSSREAQVSSSDRWAAVEAAVTVAQDSSWLGTGPGTSNPATREAVSNGLIIESSYLQLLVSGGLPALVLFGLLLAVTGALAFRRGRAGPLGALLAYAVATGGFNFLEANRPAHVLLGLTLLLCWATDSTAAVAHAPGRSAPPEAPAPRPRPGAAPVTAAAR